MQEKQIFQTNKKSRWITFQWVTRLLIFTIVVATACVAYTLLSNHYPSLPVISPTSTLSRKQIEQIKKSNQYKDFKISKKELIKIRASQINGCAFCIHMHTTDARKHGETEQRIYLLNAWKEVHGLYTAEERAVLALTEEMTCIANGGVSDETYKNAGAFFDDHQLAQIMMAIVTINGWNRIAIATQQQPA